MSGTSAGFGIGNREVADHPRSSNSSLAAIDILVVLPLVVRLQQCCDFFCLRIIRNVNVRLNLQSSPIVASCPGNPTVASIDRWRAFELTIRSPNDLVMPLRAQ